MKNKATSTLLALVLGFSTSLTAHANLTPPDWGVIICNGNAALCAEAIGALSSSSPYMPYGCSGMGQHETMVVTCMIE